MISTDDKILSLVVESLSIEQLQFFINQKKGISEVEVISKKESYAINFENWFKKKLYPPKK